MEGWVGKLADEVPGLSLTSGCGVGPTVCVSISASYALASSLQFCDYDRSCARISIKVGLAPAGAHLSPTFCTAHA